MALLPLITLWVGRKLGYLEQLCALSGLAAGHAVYIYSYDPDALEGVPAGVEVRDAADVMPRERMVAHESGSYALGSNFWRYEMLAKGLGYWIDLDVLVLKPFDFSQPYVFGSERPGHINNAVLLAPPQSEFVRDLVDLPQRPGCPQWFGPRSKLLYHLRALVRGRPTMAELPWGTFGPRIVTKLVQKHRLSDFVLPPEVFYPVSWDEAHLLYDPSADIDAMLTPSTHAIHLFNHQLGKLAATLPPQGSFLHRQFQRLGVG